MPDLPSDRRQRPTFVGYVAGLERDALSAITVAIGSRPFSSKARAAPENTIAICVPHARKFTPGFIRN